MKTVIFNTTDQKTSWANARVKLYSQAQVMLQQKTISVNIQKKNWIQTIRVWIKKGFGANILVQNEFWPGKNKFWSKKFLVKRKIGSKIV